MSKTSANVSTESALAGSTTAESVLAGSTAGESTTRALAVAGVYGLSGEGPTGKGGPDRHAIEDCLIGASIVAALRKSNDPARTAAAALSIINTGADCPLFADRRRLPGGEYRLGELLRALSNDASAARAAHAGYKKAVK